MTINKILALLLTGAMLLPQAPVFAEEAEAEIGAEAIIVEAEDASVVEGAFKKIDGSKCSGGSAMQLYVNKETPSMITMDFDIGVEGEYDVWLLASAGSVLHLSNYDYMISDEDAWRPYSGLAGGSGYASNIFNIDVGWRKLKTRTFTPGSYSFSVKAEKLRALAGDFMFAEIDALYIVPSSWEWVANGVAPPYDKRAMKFEYAGGKLSQSTVNRRFSFKATVTNKILEEIPYKAQLYTELTYKGEKVVGTVHEMAVSANKWKKGKEYSNTVQLTVPFNAPDGEYEVWTGIYNIEYANGDKMAKVGDIVVGEIPKKPEPNLLNVSAIEMPETVERQVPFTVDVKYTPSQDKKEVKPYLEFYNPKNEKELWYVAECDTAVDLVKDIAESKTFEFTIKDDVPDGEYKVRFGFHYFSNEKSDFTKVTISGGEFVRKKTHKPLSFGVFKATKSGNYQLWYVDQTHTLIWNGEPYIPMGGMYVSPYVLNMNSEDAYKHEIEILDRLKEKGVKHFYINSNRKVNDTPAWFMEHYYQLLEERGFIYGLQDSAADYGDEFYEMRAVDAQVVGEGKGSGRVVVEASGRAQTSTGNIVDASNLWVAVNTETGEVVDSGLGKSEVVDSTAMRHFADVKAPADVSYKVYFNPWVKTTSSFSYLNPFVAREQREQDFHNFYSKMETYDGLRNFIDPIKNEWGFHNYAEPRRLTGPNCDEFYVEWLKEKYSSIEELNESWKMLDPIESFTIASRIVPVYTADAAPEFYISYCVDRETGKSYRTNARQGILWDDYITFRDWKTGELNSEAADIASQYSNADVPVIVKHISIIEDYNVNHHTDSGIDGIGGEIYGSYDMATAKRTYPYSEVEQSAKTQWFLMTEGNTEESSPAKAASDTPLCYNTEEQMHKYFDDHLAQGMKGIYDFLLYWEGDPSIEVWDYDNKPECYDWNKNYREYIEANIDEIAAYERNDGNPHTWVYPGGQAWWWMPNKRRAAIHNDDYVSMRVPQWNGEPVMMTFDPFVDKEMLIVTLEDGPATTTWGTKYNEYLQQLPADEVVVQVGLRKDLGTLPIIDKYYTNEFITDGEDTIQVLAPTPTSQVLLSKDGKPYALKDGNIYIIATTAWSQSHPSSDQWRCINTELFKSVGLEYNVVKPNEKTEQTGAAEIEVSFTDIDGHWARANIENLAKQGIIAGRSASIFAPDEQVTRAELLQLMFASINMQLYDYVGCFRDVAKTDWYANVMQTANEAKIIAPQLITGASISPDKPITREETASILSKMCVAAGKANLADINKFSDAESVDSWARQDMQNVVAQQIMVGDDNNCLNPRATLTRAEAAAMITRFMGVYLAK